MKDGIAYAWYLNGGQTWFDTAGVDGRVHSLFAIRLASRLGLSIVRLLWVLLFLPAAKLGTQGFYWSISNRDVNYESRVFFQSQTWYANSSGIRSERDAIRLASRQTCLLFGCRWCVSSVPARCG